MIKNLPVNAGDTGSILGSGRSPGKVNGNPTPVFFPGKSHGQRSLMRYSLCGRTCAHTHTYRPDTDILYYVWILLVIMVAFCPQQVAEITCRDSLGSSLLPPLGVTSMYTMFFDFSMHFPCCGIQPPSFFINPHSSVDLFL